MQGKSSFLFNQVVFFGRGIDEYVDMFDLQLDALKGKRILDCCAGPAAFARQANELDIEVVAFDPMYDVEQTALRERVDADAASVTAKQAKNRAFLHEQVVPTTERRKAMELFLEDFAKHAGERYVSGALPNLPFADKSFDVSLLGNLLFIHSATGTGGMLNDSPFDLEFHKQSIRELMRVTRSEIKIYPLLAPGVKRHSFLDEIIKFCGEQGWEATEPAVRQRDIIGAETMLLIRATGAKT